MITTTQVKARSDYRKRASLMYVFCRCRPGNNDNVTMTLRVTTRKRMSTLSAPTVLAAASESKRQYTDECAGCGGNGVDTNKDDNAA